MREICRFQSTDGETAQREVTCLVEQDLDSGLSSLGLFPVSPCLEEDKCKKCFCEVSSVIKCKDSQSRINIGI